MGKREDIWSVIFFMIFMTKRLQSDKLDHIVNSIKLKRTRKMWPQLDMNVKSGKSNQTARDDKTVGQSVDMPE